MIFSCPKYGRAVNDTPMTCIEFLLQTEKRVTLVGGGAVSSANLTKALSYTCHLVAADGGADKALALGHMPEYVIGDLDSLSNAARARIPYTNLCHISEQDSTDFEKSLTQIKAPLILGVGFTGARIDHELAVYTTLARFPDRRCIIMGEEDICFMAPPELCFTTKPRDRVSLYPMGPVTGRSEGLRWPIDGIAFAPDGRVGTSNMAEGDQVTLSFDRPGMMVILPGGYLSEDLIDRYLNAPIWGERP